MERCGIKQGGFSAAGRFEDGLRSVPKRDKDPTRVTQTAGHSQMQDTASRVKEVNGAARGRGESRALDRLGIIIG